MLGKCIYRCNDRAVQRYQKDTQHQPNRQENQAYGPRVDIIILLHDVLPLLQRRRSFNLLQSLLRFLIHFPILRSQARQPPIFPCSVVTRPLEQGRLITSQTLTPNTAHTPQVRLPTQNVHARCTVRVKPLGGPRDTQIRFPYMPLPFKIRGHGLES